MKEYSKIGQWVEDLPKLGKSVFSRPELMEVFPEMSAYNIRNTLYRLSKKKKILSVWRDFYAVILPEYGLNGIPPAIEYIDQLMKFLRKDYYVALLSAAALQGASHQAPMEFFVISNSRILRDKLKGDIKINFVTKKDIQAEYITQVRVNSGYINVSKPELTAFDLIIYEKNVGGINRAATVLSEFAENLDFSNLNIDFFESIDIAVIQRLGYLLDFLEFKKIANDLFQKSQDAKLKFRKYPLSTLSEKRIFSEYEINDKWKIIVNEVIEVDDI